MSDWINDAKKKAQENNRREKEQKQQTDLSKELQKQANQAAENERFIKLVQKFREVTKETRIEIENVLSIARSQGLIVSGVKEDYYATPTTKGNYFMSYLVRNSDRRSIWDTDPIVPDYSMTYSLYWIIKEPVTEKEITICLQVQKNSYLGILENLVPSTSAPKVEFQIKAWLVEIFSEQK